MKFIVSVVILAVFAAGSSAEWSAWPAWHGHGPSLATSYPWGHVAAAPWGAPWAGAHWGGAPWNGAPWGAPWAGHGAYPHAAGSAAILPAHGHDGNYVAANRGSVHVAPLIGHVKSVSSTNLDPAPGTTW